MKIYIKEKENRKKWRGRRRKIIKEKELRERKERKFK